MEISEYFIKIIHTSQIKGMKEALKLIGLNEERLKKGLKERTSILHLDNFDVVVDKRDELNQLNFYLVEKKWSKMLLKSLQNSSEFKSMMILIGKMKIGKKNYEVRIGVFGIPCHKLVKKILNFKK